MSTKPRPTPRRQEPADPLQLRRLREEARTSLDVAFKRAQTGEFDQLGLVEDSLLNSDGSVRSKAAYLLGRIGIPSALKALVGIAKSDADASVRGVAISALEGIGRTGAVPCLIDCLKDDDAQCRDDARSALFRILGRPVLTLFSEDVDVSVYSTGEPGPDLGEASRLHSWFQEQSPQFDPDLVYFEGSPAHPGAFVARLKATPNLPMDAILMKLEDWTGVSFGASPMKKVIDQWDRWLAEHSSLYVPGQRYFFGRRVS